MALLSILYESQELLELITETMPTAVTFICNGFFSIKMKREGIKDTHGTMNFDITVLALNASIREAI